MKIFIICSKHFYHKVNDIREELEKEGYEITLPNCFEEPFREERIKELGEEEHTKFKQEMLRLHELKVKMNDAVLVLNFEKNNQPNYIGGGTFMEVVKAWELDKKIFFFNPLPNCISTDELKGINPVVINSDLTMIK
jgi:diphthamide synthase subunit DPH2